MELTGGARDQLTKLILDLAMLDLSDSSSKDKLRFRLDKVDAVIIQAIGLMDDLDKQLDSNITRVRECYGLHFPELAEIVKDNVHYVKTVKLMGDRADAVDLNFSEVLPQEIEEELKASAKISMGTEASELDLADIWKLCDQVLALSEYRDQLYDHLKISMNTFAPNLTALVGDLVGARLIADGGGLLNLSMQPGSAVQILGTKSPKRKRGAPICGHISNASLVGRAAPRFKNKISRSLAAKVALAIRCDAFGENQYRSIGLEDRAKLEAHLRFLEGQKVKNVATEAEGNKNAAQDMKPADDSANLGNYNRSLRNK